MEFQGIRLSDDAEELIRRVREACPASFNYWRDKQPHYCFALRGRDGKRSKGRGVFFVIEMDKHGDTSARPSVRLKALAPMKRVSRETLNELVQTAREAFQAMSKPPETISYQNTERHNVVGGGQFESNPHKF